MTSLPDHLLSVPAGKTPLPRQVMEEHQRERVITAAIGVFAKRGYQATTVDNIVAASKTAVGSFYALFDGKEDCFLTAYDHVVDEGRVHAAESIPKQADPPQQVVAVLRSLLGLVASEPQSARLVIVEAQTAGPEARARYERTLSEVKVHLRRCREAGLTTVELPETLEDSIIGGVTWLLRQRLVLGELDGIEGILPDLIDIMLAPYLGEEQTSELIAAL